MRVKDPQVEKLMLEYQKRRQIGMLALKAGLHLETASTHIHEVVFPSEGMADQDWRTRPFPCCLRTTEAIVTGARRLFRIENTQTRRSLVTGGSQNFQIDIHPPFFHSR